MGINGLGVRMSQGTFQEWFGGGFTNICTHENLFFNINVCSVLKHILFIQFLTYRQCISLLPQLPTLTAATCPPPILMDSHILMVSFYVQTLEWSCWNNNIQVRRWGGLQGPKTFSPLSPYTGLWTSAHNQMLTASWAPLQHGANPVWEGPG